MIVDVSSGLGSLGVVTDPQRMESLDPTLVYGSSKSALVSLTVQYAKALPAIHVNVVDPGYSATDLNVKPGTQTRSRAPTPSSRSRRSGRTVRPAGASTATAPPL